MTEDQVCDTDGRERIPGTNYRVGDRVEAARTLFCYDTPKGATGTIATPEEMRGVHWWDSEANRSRYPVPVRWDGSGQLEGCTLSEIRPITPRDSEDLSLTEGEEIMYGTVPDTCVLNPADPFEAVIMRMVETNRRKRRDYALDGSPFSNFDDTARNLGIDGFTSADSAIFNVLQKVARLRSLRKNGRMDDPQNESVSDTYLDLAVYAVIALAIHHYPEGRVEL